MYEFEADEHNTLLLLYELCQELLKSKKEENGYVTIYFDYYKNLDEESRSKFLNILYYIRKRGFRGRRFDYDYLLGLFDIWDINLTHIEDSDLTLKNLLLGEKKTGYELVKISTSLDNMPRIRKNFGKTKNGRSY